MDGASQKVLNRVQEALEDKRTDTIYLIKRKEGKKGKEKIYWYMSVDSKETVGN